MAQARARAQRSPLALASRAADGGCAPHRHGGARGHGRGGEGSCGGVPGGGGRCASRGPARGVWHLSRGGKGLCGGGGRSAWPGCRRGGSEGGRGLGRACRPGGGGQGQRVVAAFWRHGCGEPARCWAARGGGRCAACCAPRGPGSARPGPGWPLCGGQSQGRGPCPGCVGPAIDGGVHVLGRRAVDD